MDYDLTCHRILLINSAKLWKDGPAYTVKQRLLEKSLEAQVVEWSLLYRSNVGLLIIKMDTFHASTGDTQDTIYSKTILLASYMLQDTRTMMELTWKTRYKTSSLGAELDDM
jgi:hypothetical protein